MKLRDLPENWKVRDSGVREIRGTGIQGVRIKGYEMKSVRAFFLIMRLL